MIISSQRYINNEILNQKIKMMEDQRPECVFLETWETGFDAEILFDGTHTFTAATQLGIPVKFHAIPHPEGLTGADLLEQAWMDSDWYDVETDKSAF